MRNFYTKKTIKNTEAVINELILENHFKPLKNLLFCKDFLNFLPKTKSRLISAIFIKNDILNIVTKNHTFYQELNHDDSKFYIKILIKKYAKEFPLSEFSNIKDIKIYVKRYEKALFKKEDEKPIIPYLELSFGIFKNHFENKNLALKFEELRKIIKND